MSALEARIRDAERRLFARSNVSVTEHLLHLKVDGSPLRLRVLESGSGRPVLLLHPGGWFAAQWAPLLPHIPDRRLFAIDFPGHGLSDAVDYRRHDTRAHVVAMLRQLLSELGLGAASLVGNSLGGAASFWLTIDEPDLVDRLVILGVPGPVLPGVRPDLVLGLLSVPGFNRLLMKLPSSPNRSRNLSKAALGQTALARTPAEMFEIHHLASRRPQFALTLSTFLQTTLRLRSAQPHALLSDSELDGVSRPTHFIWGDDDIFGGPEMGERAAALMKHATLAVHPGGHFLQFTDPERLGRAISGFLSAQ